jgi:hypothetical protein
MTVVCTKVATLATVSKNLMFFFELLSKLFFVLSALKWHNKIKLETVETIFENKKL